MTLEGTAASPSTGDSRPDHVRWAMLAVLVTGQFMTLVDVTIVNVALPAIHRHLQASGAALQLIVSGYTVAYAMLLITGARLGVLRGTRRMFLLGMWTFTLASLACGLAPTTGVLVVARFVQGAGAAAMVPQLFSLIQRHFTGAARARAIGAYTASIAVGIVAGLVIGGALVSADLFGTSWRPVFLVNVPVGLLLGVLAARLIPDDRPRERSRARVDLDISGLVTSTAAVLLLVLPLVLGREEGWPAWTWLCFAVGAALAVGFVRVEHRVADRGGHPILNLAVLRTPGLLHGLAAIAIALTIYGGFLFSLALHLQLGLGDSPLRAGLIFVPAAATFGVTGYLWRRLPARTHHLLVPAGFAVAAAGYFGVGGDLGGGGRGGAALVVLLAVMGLGSGLAYSPVITLALAHVPPEQASDASGLLTTTLQLSQVVGVAIFGGVFLSLSGRAGVHPSATAFADLLDLFAILSVPGVAVGLLLARVTRRGQPAAA